MKLAEALLERKGLKAQVQALKERALRGVRAQEGNKPSEMPEELYLLDGEPNRSLRKAYCPNQDQ